MFSVKRGKSVLSEDTMNDELDDKDSKRKTRNLSEKKRRDQFNLLVNEVSSMVSSGGRKMDKSTVLKAAISFLKNHNDVVARSRIHEIENDCKPSFLTNCEYFHLTLEATNGFIIVFTVLGQILYVSENFMSLLDYLPNELLNSNFYEMVLEDEQNKLYSLLSGIAEQNCSEFLFSCYLKCGGFNKRNDYVEFVNFTGHYRFINEAQGTKYKYSTETHVNRVFIGTGVLPTPQLIREMSALEEESEFTSRHSLEWKFLFLDHRAPPIIGYLPFELLGTSVYDYYHVDDLTNIVSCHEALMQKSEEASCYYRFLTKGQEWIWLQTHFYITFNQWNSKPEFIVCSHRVVGYSETTNQIKDSAKCSAVEAQSTRWVTSRASRGSAESPTSIISQQSVHSRTADKCCVKTSHCYTASSPLQHPPIPSNYSNSSTPIDTSTNQEMLHADLQRKHAQLQASIGQQQAELIMVSEQLLMARLGLLAAHSPQTANVIPTFNVNTPILVANTQTILPTPLVSVTSTDLCQIPDSSLTELK